jgi:hypothetical protein
MLIPEQGPGGVGDFAGFTGDNAELNRIAESKGFGN